MKDEKRTVTYSSPCRFAGVLPLKKALVFNSGDDPIGIHDIGELFKRLYFTATRG
jgi:hypothetical protein